MRKQIGTLLRLKNSDFFVVCVYDGIEKNLLTFVPSKNINNPFSHNFSYPDLDPWSLEHN
jgi:hypothetical protein